MNKTMIRAKKIQDQRAFRPSQIDRDQLGKNVAYGVPEFLVRLVGWRRLKPALDEDWPKCRHD